MKNTEINPQTLPSDLELLIGRAFEDYGKKKQFNELEQFLSILKQRGYQFNIIKELKQVKVIPFAKFVCQVPYNMTSKNLDRLDLHEKDLARLKGMKIDAVNDGNYELAAELRNRELDILSGRKDALNSRVDSFEGRPTHVQKMLKTHVSIEKCMIHIYLITRLDSFADRVQSLIIHERKDLITWLKEVIGRK